jgi:hypothetical protein
MMKQLIHTIIIFLFFSAPSIIHAQQCDVYPADCPHEQSINIAKEKEIAITNHLLPQEIETQNEIRTFFTDHFAQIATQLHWKLYEFNEDYAPATCSNQSATPYSTKPPCSYNISFLIILNEDTLAAWKKWADDFKEKILQQSNDNVQSLQNNASANEAVTKKYMDSTQYYGNKKTAYQQLHSQQYATDIQNSNQKGIKEFESVMAKYDKIITGFTDKAYGNTNKSLGQMEQQVSENQLEENIKTQHFRDASTMLIHITVNTAVENTGIADPETQKYILPQKKWTMPGASFGGLVHNTLSLTTERLRSDGDFDMDYVHPTDIGSLFFGSWLPLKMQYNTYHAAFTASKANTDCVASKKYRCDKIQVLAMHMEGKENNITRFVQLLDTQKIGALISK